MTPTLFSIMAQISETRWTRFLRHAQSQARYGTLSPELAKSLEDASILRTSGGCYRGVALIQALCVFTY